MIVLKIPALEEPVEGSSDPVEEDEEADGTAVAGVTVVSKKPISEVEVSAVVLL